MPSNWDNWRNRDKDAYHPNFPARALARKKKVKYTCEKCGVKQGDVLINARGEPYKARVAAAHVNHDPHKARAKLIILCDRCHLYHDKDEHGRKSRRTHYRKKYEAAIQSGQLELPLLINKKKQS